MVLPWSWGERGLFQTAGRRGGGGGEEMEEETRGQRRGGAGGQEELNALQYPLKDINTLSTEEHKMRRLGFKPF